MRKSFALVAADRSTDTISRDIPSRTKSPYIKIPRTNKMLCYDIKLKRKRTVIILSSLEATWSVYQPCPAVRLSVPNWILEIIKPYINLKFISDYETPH